MSRAVLSKKVISLFTAFDEEQISLSIFFGGIEASKIKMLEKMLKTLDVNVG